MQPHRRCQRPVYQTQRHRPARCVLAVIAVLCTAALGAAHAADHDRHILATADQAIIANYQARIQQVAQMRGIEQVVGHFALRQAQIRIADADALWRAGEPDKAQAQLQAADAAAATVDLADLRFEAAIHHGHAVGIETDDLLIVMNRDMALALDRATFRLAGIYDPAFNQPYTLTSACQPPGSLIGKIVMLRPNEEKLRWREVTVEDFDGCTHRHAWRKTLDGIELVLHWQGIGVPAYEGWEGSTIPAEPGVLDVKAHVAIQPLGMSRFTCTVENRSLDLGFEQIEFPVLVSLKAWDHEDPVDYNAFGEPRPTDKTRRGGGFLGMIETQDKCSNLRFGYQAYYGHQGGIYYLPEDPDYLWKQCEPRTDGQNRTATFAHAYFALNHHGEQVKRFEASYPVAVGIFHGDWYSAARIYRRWAIRQPWCAKGTLAERDDLPDWFKQREFIQQGGGGGVAGYDTDQQIARNYGRPICIWNTHWMHYGFDDRYPDYFPPRIGAEPFKQAVTTGRLLGLHYMPYINVNHWAYDAPSHNATVKEAGARFIWGPEKVLGMRFKYGIKDMHAMVVCPSTQLWQDKVAENVRKLIQEYDCDGIYFDTLDIYCMQCSHPDHGHLRGGGNAWVRGVREILRRARAESMAAGKKVAFSGEFWRERYIGDCDAALWLSTGREQFVRDVVYHDYLTTICAEWHDRPLVPYLGSLFIAGQTQGPLGLGERYLSGPTPDQAVLAFLHYLSDCRRAFGVKYVNLGARLRDPLIGSKLPKVASDRGDGTLPAVITSAWEATDGDIGCFFMNISDNPQPFSYTIDLAQFEIGPLGTYTVKRHELGQTRPLATDNRGNLIGQETLKGGRMMMIEFHRR